MLKRSVATAAALGLACVLTITYFRPPAAVAAEATLSPVWNGVIRQWSYEIIKWSNVYGLDPDLVAAVIQEESGGMPGAVSYVGAVGLMGVMPQGPGFEFRPKAEDLFDANRNISWGCAILADILQQSGGDLSAALAAYNGGWFYATYRVPREYAAAVLHNYGRAVAARNGIDPAIARQWTVAVEINRGYIPSQPLIVENPTTHELIKLGEHVVYDFIDGGGRAHYVKGYAVPLLLASPPPPPDFDEGLLNRVPVGH